VQSQTHVPSNDNADVDVYNLTASGVLPAANRFCTGQLLRGVQ